MSSPNPYNLLAEHFNKHQYKRGAYLHSAPLDPSRRWATGRRVVISPECARVMCHKTPILTAYPDGTITLNTNGWHTNYTRDTINEALRLTRTPAYVHSRKLFGLSQWCLTISTPTPTPTPTTYAFYDNLTLSPDTHQPTNPRPFNARRIDTTQSRPFATGSREFFQALPLLYAAAPTSAETTQAYYTNRLYDPATLRRALTSQPELWPTVATWLAYETSSLPEAKRKLAAMVRADLYRTVPTTTTTV